MRNRQSHTATKKWKKKLDLKKKFNLIFCYFKTWNIISYRIYFAEKLKLKKVLIGGYGLGCFSRCQFRIS